MMSATMPPSVEYVRAGTLWPLAVTDSPPSEDWGHDGRQNGAHRLLSRPTPISAESQPAPVRPMALVTEVLITSVLISGCLSFDPRDEALAALDQVETRVFGISRDDVAAIDDWLEQ